MGSLLDAQVFAGLETVAARGPRTTEGRGRGQRTEDRGRQVASSAKPHTTKKNMELVTNFIRGIFLGDKCSPKKLPELWCIQLIKMF